MIKPSRSVSEATLNVNLNELVHNLARELSMACRKVGIYGVSHPMASRAIEKPFFAFNRLFTFKRFISFNISQGHLSLAGIRLKESPFTDEIMRHMQVFDVEAILFERRLTMAEMTKFIGRFVQRVTLDDHSNLLSTFLKQNKIDTVEVNSERAFALFEGQHQYRGDCEGDFSVKYVALQQMGDDLEVLGAINRDGAEALLERNIDFLPDVIRYLMPEKVTAIPVDSFVESLVRLLTRSNSEDDEAVRAEATAAYEAVWKLLDYSSDRERIIEKLQMATPDAAGVAQRVREAGDTVNAIRIESRERVDELLSTCLESTGGDYPSEEFVGALERLMHTGQRGKAIEVLSRLLDYLTSQETSFRGRALDLLDAIVARVDILSDADVFSAVVTRVGKVLDEHAETFEYAEFVWRICHRAITTNALDRAATLSEIVGRRRNVSDGVSVFDSIGIKRIIENVNRPEVITHLVDELVRAGGEQVGHIRTILTSCGGEQAAIGLSQVISHPIRHVRQQALKILAELGKDSLKVFTDILMDDSMFERDPDRSELADSRWYVVRNSIFVLGLLEDPEGITPLRLRINDMDIRIRREIVATLEKIGGDDACDLLIVMSEDPSKEIRERAIIAVGLIGEHDIAPLVIDVVERTPTLALRGICALGKIGGEAAVQYLGQLLADTNALARRTSGSAGKDEIRLAIVRALGEIGDPHSIGRLRQFKENLSTTQKVLFRGSTVNKTLSEILERH